MPTQDVIDWDVVAGNNTSVDGLDVNEGCPPANINNAIRAKMAASARFVHALTGEKVTGGTANAQTLTTGLQWATIANNILAFKAGTGLTNTGAATINVDGLGAKAIKLPDGSDLPAGAITAGGLYLIAYNADNSYWTLMGGSAASLPLAGGTLSGEVNFADNLATRPKIKDYGEAVVAHGNSGSGTEDFDLESGNVHTVTITSGTVNITFSNPPASGTAGSLTIIMTNGGSQTVNWPASVDWPGSTAPTLTTSGVDIISFLTVNGGTTWYGFPGGLSMG